MSREDITSAVLLLLLSLLSWWAGLGRARESMSLGMEVAVPHDNRTDPVFQSRGIAFHLSCPPGWVWEPTQTAAPADGGWESLGRFVAPRQDFLVTTRKLDREVDVFLLLGFEVERMRWSTEKTLVAEGRRPRMAMARLWRCRDGRDEPGWLGLVSVGQRWFRVVAWVDPEFTEAGMTTALEVIRSLQPASRSCTPHAVARCRWRPARGGEITVAYPASWSRQSERDDGTVHLLHLRSRSSGRVRGVLVLCAGENPLDDAALIDHWLRLEPEFAVTGAPEASRTPESALLRVRHDASGEMWSLSRRRLRRASGGLTVLLATPEMPTDPWANMFNQTAYESVCSEVTWER